MRRCLLVILLLVVLPSCGGGGSSDDAHGHGGHGRNSSAAEGARVVRVDASSFEFEPASIEARPGEELAIELMAQDAEHDFVIDELDAHIGAEAGAVGRGGLTAGEPGTYTYYCSIDGHREAGMEGRLVVG